MKMFVVAAYIFTILMYLVYAFAFPVPTDSTKDGKLSDLYHTIMIFSVISAILVICQIMSGGRRIEQMNADYGKAVKFEGLVFFGSNIVAAIFFYLLGDN